MSGTRRRLGIILCCIVFLVSCRQQQPTASDIRLSLSVSDEVVGETTLVVAVSDEKGKPIANPGTLRVRGDMNHAGMAPVLAESGSASDGEFSLPFEWTMSGSWIVEASLTLPDGTVATETFSYDIRAEAGGEDAASMDHSGLQHDDMTERSGESSAVYMRIANRGDDDMFIVSASSPAAEHIAFHQTVIENDMARMNALDSLLIPAGESVELAPGGLHLMLMGLAHDLKQESLLPLRLHGDKGEVYELAVSIMEMPAQELEDEVQIGDLVFSNGWARPARAGRLDSNESEVAATPSS